MIVELCVHGEAKPHGGFDDDGAIWEPCPGGRVLEQAIIIERDADGNWPRRVKEVLSVWYEEYRRGRSRGSFDELLDVLLLNALASAQENQQ